MATKPPGNFRDPMTAADRMAAITQGPTSVAQFKDTADRAVQTAREEGYHEGQRDALRAVLDMLQGMLMELPGISPEYAQTLSLTKQVAKLRDTLD